MQPKTETSGTNDADAAELPATTTPDTAPTIDPPPAATDPAPDTIPPKRSGFVPLVLGGVIAALIGAGGTIYALPNLPPQLANLLPRAVPDTAMFDTALAEQKAQIDSLKAEIATLRATPPTADLSGVQGALDEANSGIRSLTDRMSGAETRLNTLETRPVIASDGTAVGDATALQSQIDTLRQQIAAAGQADTTAQQQITEAASAARAQIDAVQAEAQKLRADSESAVQRSIAQAAIARVAAALQSGVPLAPALADAEAAGLTVPAALKAPIPSLPLLQSSFPEAARAALTAARKSTAGESFWQRAGAFVMAQTGARSVVPRQGDGADAVLSRIQASVDAGDIRKAISETDALPQAAQAMLSGWITQAQARIAAGDAMIELAQSVK